MSDCNDLVHYGGYSVPGNIPRQNLFKSSRNVPQTDVPTQRTETPLCATLNEVLDQYIHFIVEVELKPRSQDDYKWVIEKFIRPHLGHLPIDKVSRNHIRHWMKLMCDKKRTANKALSVLKRVFNLTIYGEFQELHIPSNLSNPCQGIRKYQEIVRDRFFSEAELKTIGQELNFLLKNKKYHRDGVLVIKMLALTGMRLSEVCNLQWEYVDFERLLITIPDSKTGRKTLVIDEVIATFLRGLEREGRFVFRNRDKTDAISLFTVEDIWKRIRKKLGLNDARLHDFRHTKATLASQFANNAFTIRDMLGHKSISSTTRYVSRAHNYIRSSSLKVSKQIEDLFG